MPDSPSIYDQIAQLAGQVGAIRKNDSPTQNYPTRPYRGARGGFRGGRGRGGYYPPRNNYSYSQSNTYRGRYPSYNGGRSRGFHPYSAGRGRGRGSSVSPYRSHRPGAPPVKIETPCAHYTRTGTCLEAKTCKYKHDPKHVALCLPYFKTGNCPKRGCTLNHTLTPENTPMCLHNARGRCTREDCKFAHMAHAGVDDDTCREFALLGWCNKGLECSKRHVFECPDFESTGVCPRPKCHLQHITRRPTDEEPGKDTEDSNPGEEIEDQVNLNALLDNLSNNFEPQEQSEDNNESNGESEDEVYALLHVTGHDSDVGYDDDEDASEQERDVNDEDDNSGFILI